jgi:HEAT repeat protein
LLRDLKGVQWDWQRAEIIKKLIAKGDKSVVPEFARMLASENRRLRLDAGWVLAGLGDDRGLPAVIAELADTSDRPVPPLPQNGGHYYIDLRLKNQIASDHWYAAWVLEKFHDPRAVSALIRALQDPDVSMEAAIALAHNNDERAVPALLAALERAKADGQPRGQLDMRFWAAYGLMGLRHPQGTKTMAEFVIGEHDVPFTPPANADPVTLAALAEGAALMRRTAADCFVEFPDKAAVPALIAATADKNVGVRVAAITALGRTGDEAALPILRALLSDSATEAGNVHIGYDPPKFARMTVREAAAKAIEEIDRRHEKK